MFRNYSPRLPSIRLLERLLVIAILTFVIPLTAAAESHTFFLNVNPAFLNCLARFPNDPARRPRATVTVTRGKFNDTLLLKLKNIKPKLVFDLFTVQRSNLLADGTEDPSFTNFGLAWYQSEFRVTSGGTANLPTWPPTDSRD